MNKLPSKSEPLGILAALQAGFDAVTRTPQVMLMPVLLDGFLWLGPRLSAYPLIKNMVTLMSQWLVTPDETLQRQWLQSLALLEQAGQQFNLFAWLSPLLLGVPSLMAGNGGDKRPWPQPPPVWEVKNILVYLGLFGLLSLVGLGMSAVYWSQIADVTRTRAPNGVGPEHRWAHVWHIWIGLVELVGLFILIALVLGLPLLMVSAFVGVFSPLLAQFLLLMGLTLVMWVMFYLAFVVHGLALRHSPFLEAVQISLAIMRWQFLPAMGLIGLSLLIYLGLGVVWNMAESDSWLKAGAIMGHAFTASGVLCATAFFYLGRTSLLSQGREPTTAAD